MNARTMRAGAAWFLTAGLIGGCESTPTRVTYADNPLLQARQPLLQPQGAPITDTTQVAQSGPRMVPVPPPGLYQQQPATLTAAQPIPSQAPAYTPTALAAPPLTPLAAAPSTPAPMPVPSVPVPASPAVVPTVAPSAPPIMAAPMPVPAPIVAPPAVVPAVAPSAPPITPAVIQTSVRTAEGKYGHSADYTWLQGELDRHYRGYLELRYRSIAEDDLYGGKVRLEDDPRLAEFRPGDVIAVEGELLTDPDGANAAPWSQFKRFHIRAIRLVERK